jgi:hypothetical protein
VHRGNSIYHNGRKIQKYFARKKDENRHPVYSPDLSPFDFWLFGYTKKQLKDQLITDEGDLEGKLTNIWEHLSRDVLQSVFFEWMERSEWVTEHEEDYCINPHELNKNLIDKSREDRGGSYLLLTPIIADIPVQTIPLSTVFRKGSTGPGSHQRYY